MDMSPDRARLVAVARLAARIGPWLASASRLAPMWLLLPLCLGTLGAARASPLALSPATLPGGAVGSPYTHSLQASGGTPPYNTIGVTSGALPPGSVLGPGSVSINFTPVVTTTYTFTLIVTDSVGGTLNPTYSIVVKPVGYAYVSAGSPQSTAVNSAFATRLQVYVAVDSDSAAPVEGALVTFDAPGSGPSGGFAGLKSVFSDANGTATAPPFRANSTPGPYAVTAVVTSSAVPPLPLHLANTPAAGSPQGAMCWYASYSGSGDFSLLKLELEGTPLSDLRFSRSYNDPTDLSRGYLDFDRDGKSDVFSTKLRPDGNYQWRYSSGGTGPWVNLAYDPTPPDQLRFGDFNGDGYTDVFSTLANYPSAGEYQWRYSSKGQSSWILLAHNSVPTDQLRFGDFNADGKTDVFFLSDLGNGYFGWEASLSDNLHDGGAVSVSQINSATTPLSELAFGDINGEGHTDVFAAIPTGTGFNDFYYSSAGIGAYQFIGESPLSIGLPMLAGDFNGDFRTDFQYTTPDGAGGTSLAYLSYNAAQVFGQQFLFDFAGYSPQDLRFADFNGDGFTDVLVMFNCETIFADNYD